MDNLHILIRALEDYYQEHGERRGLEYTYGFMDALAVVREVATAPVRYIGHQISHNEYDKTISDTLGHF